MEDITKDVTEQIAPEESVDGIAPTDASTENEDTPEIEAERATEEPQEESSPLEALMRCGLSEREALLVLDDREQRRSGKTATPDSLPRMAHSPRMDISYGELMQMKEIFEGLSDTEINRLYNKVTK